MTRGSGLAIAALLAVVGCGGDDGSDRPRLTVSAAASLRDVFEDYGARFEPATVRFSFAGSDALAAQIRQGVTPDVYAAANTELPKALHRAGLVEKPVVFARNRLVVAVPDESHVESLNDLAKPGTALATGAESVPIGAYTRAVLERLPGAARRAILANVRSREPDVTGIVGKLVGGAAEAGFVYATDVASAGRGLRAIELPPRLAPEVEYGVVVLDGPRRREARAFVMGLLRGEGREALYRAGFR